MATYISKQSGNLSAAATWGNVEAGSGALTTGTATGGNTAAAYATAIAFTATSGDNLVGVLMSCKQTTATGTVTVGISADNGSTWAKEVTVNATDLPTAQSWVLFLFATPLAADGGNDYKISFKGSSAGNATFYRDGTANNWAHVLRLDTAPEAAPTTADRLFVAGQLAGGNPGTLTSYTVTMDDTTSIDFGAIDVGVGGTLAFGVAESTAYTLKVSGDLTVWAGATLTLGTVASPMPASSTGWLTLDCGSNVQYGLLLKDGHTLVMQGASKTVSALLAADGAVNATSLTTGASTGWKDNDSIAIASTTRTAAQCEKGLLNGDAAGTALTVDGFGGAGGGLAYAHSGTSPTQAEIVNLTRNVGVHGASASLQGYISIAATGALDVDYAEFYWLGSVTAGKRGIDVLTTTGSVSVQYSALHDFAVTGSVGFYISAATNSGVVFAYNVGYAVERMFFYVAATSGTWTCTNNISILCGAAAGGTYGAFYLADSGGTFTDNVAVGSLAAGILITEAGVLLEFDSVTAHSNAGYGIEFGSLTDLSGSTLSNLTIWRNNAAGIELDSDHRRMLTIGPAVLFGNVTANMETSTNNVSLTLFQVVSNGDSTFSTAAGLSLAGGFSGRVHLVDCEFSTVGGIKTAHTQDISWASSEALEISADYTKFGATPFSGMTDTVEGSGLFCQAFNRVSGDNRSYLVNGTIRSDTAIYKTAAPGERLTPSTAAFKLESSPIYATVDSGGTVTFSVWVRKSEAADADGADYNGNQPRLVLKRNYAAGIFADTVLDTMSVGLGEWEQLSGTSAAVSEDTVLTAVVDCDGTQGWINVDD